MRYKEITPGAIALALVTAFAPRATLAQESSDLAPAELSQSEVEDLRATVAALRSDYDRQIKALEERILQLEEMQQEPTPAPDDELSALRAAADEAAATVGTQPTIDRPPTIARQANLNRLNPEISATGDLLAITSSQDREEFRQGEFELNIQANLDPFSVTRWTLAVHEEGEIEIEEGYLKWASLPGGLDLSAGKFRQRFGAINRQHRHALPQTNYPLVIDAIFGDEGLGQIGLSAAWLLGKPWASANEIILEITDGENDFFGGEDFEHLAALGRLTNYWDLSSSTYFEWGLTGIVGRTNEDGDAKVWGTDLTYHWQPPGRAKYREITWRTEAMLAQRENTPGEITDAWGAYTYVEGLIARSLYLGARLDWTEDPFEPLAETWAISPYITWWQSEWVRLRAEYQHRDDELIGETDNRFTLQLTWSAGPHKHDTY